MGYKNCFKFTGFYLDLNRYRAAYGVQELFPLQVNYSLAFSSKWFPLQPNLLGCLPSFESVSMCRVFLQRIPTSLMRSSS